MKNKPMTRISLQDIADKVGVSRSTVSLVLNGKQKEGRISDKIADKIKKCAREMNYRCNELAKGLRTGSTRTIAFIVANISDIFFAELAFYMQECAEENGYSLMIFNTGEKKERLSDISEILMTKAVDGVIMVPISNTEEECIDDLFGDVPIVYVDRYFDTFRASRVIINNYEISKNATLMLIEKGCKKIAMISYKESLMHMRERERGFIDALSSHRCYDEGLLFEIDYFNSKNEIVDILGRRIRDGRMDIDGIFLASGGISSLAVRYLVKKGLRIQENIQLIGFGRMEVATRIPIPYVKQPLKEICEHAFDILMNQIQDKDYSPVDCMLPASIVVDDF